MRIKEPCCIICFFISIFIYSTTVSADQYTYDSLGRVKSIEYDDGSKALFQYDKNGNIESVKSEGKKQLSGESGNVNGNGNGNNNVKDSAGGGNVSSDSRSKAGDSKSSTNRYVAGKNDGAIDNRNENNSKIQNGSPNDMSIGQTGKADDGSVGSASKNDQKTEKTTEKTTKQVTKNTNSGSAKVATTTGSFRLSKNGTAAFMSPKSAKRKTVKIPDTVKYKGKKYKVTAIGKEAFRDQKNLQMIIIGKNITTIRSKAFYGCGKLKKVIIRSSKLKKVEKGAFSKISKDAVFTISKNKAKKYKKLLKKSGLKKVKIKS